LIQPDGHFEQRAYDEYNRLIRVTDARGGQTNFAHDSFGRVIAVRDAGGGVARLAYEAGAGGFAAPTSITRPDGVIVSRAYDREGTLSSVTDGEGRQWTYEHGAFGVLKAIGDPKGGRLSFEHDSEGRLVAVTNARGQVWRFERDVAGQVVAEEDFDGRRIAYGYDPAGRLIERRHGDGARQVYAYDKSGLLIREESFEPGEAYPSEVTRYWYDARGLLAKAENKALIVTFERDRNGRIIAESLNGRAVESLRDENGRRIARRIGEGLVRLARDPLGLVASIAIDSHAPLAFSRDALGRETRRESASGFRLSQSYDAVGQLLSQIAAPAVHGLEGAIAAQRAGVSTKPTMERR
jgi:YD repeat-containing protein